MKAIIINLERSTERRRRVVSEVEKAGVDYEIFPAVDGRLLADAELSGPRIAQSMRTSEYYSRTMIGAALSHIGVYEKILKEDIRVALVLEDDVVLMEGFAETLKDISATLAENEVVLLHYMSARPLMLLRDPAVRVGGTFVYRPADFSSVNSGAAYVVTNAAARSLLGVSLPASVEADSWQYFYDRGGFKSIRFAFPMPVNVRGEKSTIAEERQGIVRRFLTAAIDRYQIPPFHSILRNARLRSIEARSTVMFTDEHDGEL